MRLLPLATLTLALSTVGSLNAGAASLSNAEATRDGNQVTLTWDADASVDVLMTGDPNASPDQMTVISDNDRDGMHTVRDLRGVTRPYFYLQPQDGEGQRVAVRLLPLEGGRNFRDMGGYPTEDGRHVKWGHVFRSGMMAELTNSDYDYLSTLGVQTICDFRANEERADEPTQWAAGKIDYVTWDYSTVTGSEELAALFQDPDLTPAKVKNVMAEMYPGILEEHKHHYKVMFERLAEGQIPLAFNCSAGKDRAGTAAALILSALGVHREDIVHDYSLSETFVDYAAEFTDLSPEEMESSPYAFLASLPPAILAPLLRSDPDYIRVTFDYMDEKYGGVDAFIRTELGVDDMKLAAIRSQLLE